MQTIEKDTVRLLRECDAGIQMGVKSIDDVIDRVKSEDLKKILDACRDAHERLDSELQALLESYHDDGKEPKLMAETMAKIKTEMKMLADASDATIADLITDGCNMGVKSLSRYLNQYAAADEKSKDITKKLIRLESDLATDLRDYL